ncbi:hypothetical protein, partial [Frankia canadensis]|uniref:hypothetical protein n=1 Tax=Frankia canadensis TaxID=1836972 RepID=UPI001FAEF769
MRRLVRRHAVFGVLALLGAVGRILVLVAYPPALMYLGDSGAYLDQAWRGLWPGDWRPSGYPIFLRLLDGPEHITRVVIVQHVLTLVVAGGLYAVAVRAVRRPWLAALAATPALLAPWILDLGQFVLADSLFGVLTTAGVALLAWPNRAGPRAAALAGLLLGAALCVRTVGYGPLAVALVTLIVDAARRSPRPWRADISGRNLSGADLPAPTVTGADMPRVDVPRTGVSRTGMRQRAWRRVRVRRVRVRRVAPVMAFVVGAAMPVGAYAGWSAAAGEGFAVSAHSGFFLYGRVAPFADCADVTAAGLRSLCDPRPVGQRGAPVRYLWPADSPLRQGHRHIPPGREELAGRFAHEVVRQQPWMLVTSSARYLAGYFSPVPYETAKTSRADTWELPTDRSNALPPSDPHADDGYFVATAVRGPSGLLAEWSRVSYPLMPMVGLGLLAGLTAAVIAAVRALRARRSPRQADGTGVSNVAVDATPEAEAEVGPGAD